ncbi:30S ribosomal protein S6 [Caldisericum sp. AR60]|uniref:30S ribosomal protein S6 n=1 Tax=Caldisericum sp. AR60 TaxID=3397852 RepID=UPI0039FBA69F
MNYYEVLYIVSANLSDEERAALVSKFHEFVERNGGSLKSESEWGLKTLAYPILKQDRGYYYLAYVNLPASAVKDLYYFFRVTDGFLRAMIVKKVEKEVKSAPKEPEVKEEQAGEPEEVQENV